MPSLGLRGARSTSVGQQQQFAAAITRRRACTKAVVNYVEWIDDGTRRMYATPVAS